MHAVLMALGRFLGLDGALTTSSASSPVTSATRTVRGAGTLRFSSVLSDGGTPQYSHNGGAFASITEGMTLAVVSGDTLAVRATLITVGFTASFTLANNASGVLIEGVTLTRT